MQNNLQLGSFIMNVPLLAAGLPAAAKSLILYLGLAGRPLGCILFVIKY
jgi:hypothetical protein